MKTEAEVTEFVTECEANEILTVADRLNLDTY